MADSNKKITVANMLEKAIITKPDDKSIRTLMKKGSKIKNHSGPNSLTEAAKHGDDKITEAALRAASEDANKNNSSGVASLKEASKDYSSRMAKGIAKELSKDDSDDKGLENY